jgi:hypothetical protein
MRLWLLLWVATSVAISPQDTLTIPEGTELRIRTTQGVSGDSVHVGDDVAMEVLADVSVNGYVVIRQGAPVIGVVSRAKEAKSLGRRGHVAVSLKYAESITGDHVLLSGARSEEGKGKKAKIASEVAVTAVLVGTPLGLLWLFEKGNDSFIPPGTAFTVFTVADTRIDLQQLPKGAKLLRSRPSGPENLAALGIVIDTNQSDFRAKITSVVQGGPGDRANLRVGYLITAVNRVPTHNVREVSDAIAAISPGSASVTLGYLFPSNLGLMPTEKQVILNAHE